jgi:hypothetical protein
MFEIWTFSFDVLSKSLYYVIIIFCGDDKKINLFDNLKSDIPKLV